MLGVLGPRGRRRAAASPWPRLVVSAVAVVIGATACSSGGRVAADQSSPPVNPTTSASATTTPSGQPSATTGAPGTAPASSNGTSAPSATATAGGSATPSASRPPLPLTASLAHSCVEPGHSQSLHVHTLPKAEVIYDSIYSDGHDGAVYGGRGNGAQADAKGNYDSTWTILPTAPLGKVKVEVAAAGGNAQTASHELTFVLKAVC